MLHPACIPMSGTNAPIQSANAIGGLQYLSKYTKITPFIQSLYRMFIYSRMFYQEIYVKRERKINQNREYRECRDSQDVSQSQIDD